MAAEGVGIGALAVRIGANADGLLATFDKAGKAADGLGGKFAQASKVAAVFAAAASAAGVAVLAMVKHTVDSADQLGKMAQRVGVNVEALSALKYAAKLSDVSLEQLGTGLKQLSKNMLDAQAGTGDAKEAFKALGLQVAGSGGQLKLTEEMFGAIAEKFAGMEDSAGKTALAMKIFGRSGADLIPLLNGGRAGLAAATEEARRFGVIVTQEAAKAAEVFNDNLTRLGSVFEGMKMELGKGLIPQLTELSQQMLDGTKIAGGFFNALIQFSGINPFRSTGGNIRELNKDLENLISGRALMAGMVGYEAAVANVDRQITVVENRIKFLKAMQQRDALALAGPDTLDARDLMARGPAAAKTKAPALPNDSAVREAEAREQAVRDAMHTVRTADDQRELGQIGLQNEQKAALEQEARKSVYAGWAADDERRVLHGEETMAIARRYQNQISAIESRGIQSRQDWEEASNLQRAQSVFGAMANITAGVAQHNKKLFEMNKIAGIANAVINASVGISKTLSTYPYPYNIALAALHAAAAFAQVSAIRSASFSGAGGAAPSLAGGTAATPVSPVGGGPAGASAGSGNHTTIILQGDTASMKQVRQMLEDLNEGVSTGGRFVVQ